MLYRSRDDSCRENLKVICSSSTDETFSRSVTLDINAHQFLIMPSNSRVTKMQDSEGKLNISSGPGNSYISARGLLQYIWRETICPSEFMNYQ